MKCVQVESYPVSIFIGGLYEAAHEACLAYCRNVGLCVTVTATSYVHTDGADGGVVVGLINYPRFPKAPEEIWARACDLGAHLLRRLRQQSYTIQAPDKTVWFSHRPEPAAMTPQNASGEGGRELLAGSIPLNAKEIAG